MKEVINSSNITEDKISKLLKCKAKKKAKEILQSLEGSHIESCQYLKMVLVSDHKKQLDAYIKKIESEMAIRCITHSFFINML